MSINMFSYTIRAFMLASTLAFGIPQAEAAGMDWLFGNNDAQAETVMLQGPVVLTTPPEIQSETLESRNGFIIQKGYYTLDSNQRTYTFHPAQYRRERPGYTFQQAGWVQTNAGYQFQPAGFILNHQCIDSGNGELFNPRSSQNNK